MQSLKRERLFWWVTVPALVAVLATLAILQYRWSGQISTATRAQMQSNLQTSLMGFRQDLSRELSSMAVEVRAAAGDNGVVRATDFNRQLQHWQQTAAHPALVEGIYFWKNSRRFPERLDTAHDQLEPASWPEGSEKLQQHLQGISFVAHTGTSSRGHFMPRLHPERASAKPRSFDSFIPWLVDPNVPALVYPLRPRADEDDSSAAPAITWIIVKLNTGVLEKEIFPELAQKYFRGTGGMDYHVAVVGLGRDRVLYSSDPGLSKPKAVAFDAAVNLFGPPFRRNESPPPSMVGFPANMKAASPGRSTQPNQSERSVRLEPLPYSLDDGLWQVAVTHQRGSLEAAVSGLHRRNLMISFGVLVLLAFTMTLVVIASHRTRRLAALQMNFVAGVSHELRTPLAVISSAAENIAHGVVSDQQQLARYGSSILKQARQLNQLVEQVLVFAATQQRHGNYQLHPVNVIQVIDAALENTATMAAAAGITVERQIEPDLPPVAADFSALVQCLQNLITNAIKYGGEGRWMGIRAARRHAGGVAREIELSVEDRGIGISPGEIKQIFEPFYRSTSVAGSNVHGTGLGLPLARAVIEAMRGRLTVTSEPGRGSSFTIHLGVAPSAAVADEETAPDGIAGEAAGNLS
jgi:two-component system, OmpR family, sensor histidine kinase SenX3